MRKPTDFPDPAPREGLEDLVFLCLERMEAEGESALLDLCRLHPDSAGSLTDRIRTLQSSGLLAPLRETAEPPGELGEFRLLRRLGTGGMGVVYLAEQPSLGRQVAIKLLRAVELHVPEARARFRREVEAVAKLAHPNIAPVHTVGEEAGVPYFAMEYVPGLSLAEVVEAFAARDPAELHGRDLHELLARQAGTGEGMPEFGGDARVFEVLWTRAAVLIARQVAEAVEHAHRRGVAHRDIKPSNVMVDAAGRVLLVDFGLASTPGNERLTRSGALLGSLPYLSPERLGGAAAEAPGRDASAESAVAARAGRVAGDVYALGVTLYELLALRLPFAAEGRESLLEQARAGAPPPLRRLNAAVSLDLATVCAKAMAPEPEARYASADALARDLTNVLEGRPVEARPDGPWVRLARWRRRRPGWAAAAGLLALGAIVGPTVFGIQAQRGKQRIAEERDRSLSNHKRALAAVDLLTRTGGELLADVPEAQLAHQRLLEEGLGFWRAFVAEEAGDPLLRLELAEALLRIGYLQEQLGHSREALASLDEAAERLHELWRESGDPARLSSWASARREQGAVLVQLGEGAAGGALLAEAVAGLEALGERRTNPIAEGERRRELAYLETRLASLAKDSGEPRPGGEHAERALEHYAAADALLPPDAERTRGQARTWSVVAAMHFNAGRYEQARDAYEAALPLVDEALRAEPQNHRLRSERVATVTNLGTTLLELGELADADLLFAEAADDGERLVRDHPGVPTYRETVWMAHNARGGSAGRQGRYEEAAEALEHAADAARAALRLEPEAARHRALIGLTELNQSNVLVEQGRFAEARDVVNSCLAHYAVLLARFPGSPEFLGTWNMASRNLAAICMNLGDWPGAAAAVLDMRDVTNGQLVVRAAVTLAVCIGQLETAGELSSAERELWSEAAVELLAEALALGHLEVRSLVEDSTWDSLRDAPGFAELIE